MKGFCFIITDKHHNIYYSSDNTKLIFGNSPQEIVNNSWFNFIKGPTSEFIEQLIEHDISELGYFNGFLSFNDTGTLWYCDYGRRYDTDGKQTGYELTITYADKSTSEYMNHFYENLENKAKASPSLSPVNVYKEEQMLIQKNVGTEYHEFLLALQANDNE